MIEDNTLLKLYECQAAMILEREKNQPKYVIVDTLNEAIDFVAQAAAARRRQLKLRTNN